MGKKLTNEEFLQKIKDLNIKNIKPLEEYKGRHEKIKWKCLNLECGHEWYAQPGNIFQGRGCPKCGILKRAKSRTFSNEQFLEKFKETGNKNIKVLGEYTGTNDEIECECLLNETHPHFFKTGYSLLKGEGCPYCSGAKLTEERKFKNIHPELMKYLKNKEDGEKSAYSSDIIEIVCPDCGNSKEITLSNFSNQGFMCPICGENISFPNRVLRKLLTDESILKQVNNVEIEWRPENWDKRVFFDGKIEINGKIICIEMQGKQHKTGMWNGKKDDTIFKRDNYKREKCKECGYIEVEVDCKNTYINNIKNNIINSDLKFYLDFSGVNWDNVLDLTWDSLLIKICKEYDNSYLSIKEIEEKLNLKRHTIFQYLRRGLEAGILKRYSVEDSKKRQYLYVSKYIYELYDSDNNLLIEDIGSGNFQKSIKDITGILIPQNTLLSSNSNSFQKLKNFSFKKKLNNKKDRKRLSKKYFNY